MRCIFCKQESSTSITVEHIIPESLGNKEYVLSPGIVCDRCNNYFSRKVELPFLEHHGIKILRFQEQLVNKKNNLPALPSILSIGAVVNCQPHFGKQNSIKFPGMTDEQEERLKSKNTLMITTEGFSDKTPLPEGNIVSRFLAKIALEAYVYLVARNNNEINEIVDYPELDLLRNHARKGTTPNWPYSIRYIYDTDARWKTPDGGNTQILHELDFLYTDNHELYCIFVLLGIEFVINMVGPGIDGYSEWLKQHDNICPLSYGHRGEMREKRFLCMINPRR
ncbi:MAG: HNH endonuclease [Methanocorpusculum sp.]|uniref:HNH endonuclease n=1 Tax=Methanocorpusculum sp. TaxID=2058474 RepID=UPI002B1FFDB5|nr:HNH endonuclease [Methanocorpusculum sp.]MEA5087105.1 HNH endonuclease [Methanocorpusculum sp.]